MGVRGCVIEDFDVDSALGGEPLSCPDGPVVHDRSAISGRRDPERQKRAGSPGAAFSGLNRGPVPVSDKIDFRRGGFEFRDSGHVFRGDEFLGHVAYSHNPKVRAAWERYLNS